MKRKEKTKWDKVKQGCAVVGIVTIAYLGGYLHATLNHWPKPPEVECRHANETETSLADIEETLKRK